MCTLETVDELKAAQRNKDAIQDVFQWREPSHKWSQGNNQERYTCIDSSANISGDVKDQWKTFRLDCRLPLCTDAGSTMEELEPFYSKVDE